MTPQEFASKVKAKYPEYQNMDDLELTSRIIKKYPQYESKVQMPTTETPNTVQRVGSTIIQAGQEVRQQIKGEGEFAGESPVVRGLGAASSAALAIPETAIQAIPEPLGGGLIRGGLEKIGDVASKGFNKVTSFLGGTELFKGAAGQAVPQGDGSFDYVPNDLGFLEDALKSAQSLGEVAGVTAGAGAGPSQVSRLAGRAKEAIVDVGREALDRTLKVTDNLSERVTPKTVRTALRINEPETRSKAITELEDAYKTGLIEGRKATNNKLETLAAGESIAGAPVTRDMLIRELAEEGYTPKIEGQFAKFDEVFDDIETRQRNLMDDLDRELAPLTSRIESQTSLDRIMADAEAALRNNPQIGAGLTSSLNELNRMFKSFAEKYGDTLTPIEVNQIRKEMNRVTKAYKAKGGEAIFEMDTADAVGKATRQRLDEVVPSGKVSALNKEWARLNRVEQTARILNNEIVETGIFGRKIGSYVTTVGASLVGLNLAGPGGLIVASIFAQLGGDAFATFLRNKKFRPELRDAILKQIKEDPKTADRLIREASPENKAFLRNAILGGASIAATKFFLGDDEAGAAAAVLVGSTGGKTPITGRALDRVEEYIDWSSGIKKVSGQELIDLKADAQLIAEGAGIKATGGDKSLGNELRKALDKQNFSKK